jgi:hypothetical protein
MFNSIESLELSYLSLSQTLTQQVVSFDDLFHADELWFEEKMWLPIICLSLMDRHLRRRLLLYD